MKNLHYIYCSGICSNVEFAGDYYLMEDIFGIYRKGTIDRRKV